MTGCPSSRPPILGTELAYTVIEFDQNGQATHPFARDASGNLRVVNAADYGAAAGDQLVVFQLPYGSFVPDQPEARILVTLDVSSLADVGAPLQVSAVGGFAYGGDPLNNPTADPPILGTPAAMQLTPMLFTLDKTFNGAEQETATGPNFAKSYTIDLDLATGQEVTNLVLTDLLPDGIVVLGTSGLPAGFTVVYDAVAHAITVTQEAGGTLTGIDGIDLSFTIDFYVAETMAPGDSATPVLDPVTGAPRELHNDVAAWADWTPLDLRDEPMRVEVDREGPEETFVARSIATQKTQAVIVDNNAGGLGPGDIIEYTIDVQISDYFDFQNLRLSDLLSDGQSYINGTAQIQVIEGGALVFSGAFAGAYFVTERNPTTGQTAIAMNVSGLLVANGNDGVLNGGDGANGATTLRITYQAAVERFFVEGDGTVAVGQGDTLTNEVDVSADVVDETGAPTGYTPTDDTSSSATIQTGSVSKSVYAVNGEMVGSGPIQIAAGDLITFRLTYTMPQTLTQELRLVDFLPLPVFDVDSFTLALLDDLSGNPPGENVATWGPLAAAFRAELIDPLTGNVDPARIEVLTNEAANSLTFVFTNLSPEVPTNTTADILFTIRVTDEPFGDGLLLTNQVFAIETSTDQTVTASEAITQITLTEPILQITKGVVATDNPDGTITGSTGPVTFNAPGTAGERFSGTISSGSLLGNPIDGNLGNVDAGDRVTFALVIENTGSGRDGAFDVRIMDSLPPGFEIPAGGLNLRVTDGAGQEISYTGDLFGAGIELVDGDHAGAIAAHSATSGGNIVVITYDLVLTNQVQAQDTIVNTATIDSYAAVEGGIDRVPGSTAQTSDDASVGIAAPTIVKTTSATSVAQTDYAAGNPNLADLVIGETITFDLTVTLQEGRTQDFVILDSLPEGLTFVSASLVSIGSNIFVRNADGTTGALLGAPTVTATGGLVTFTFADDIINRPDGEVTAADRIVVSVTAVVTDVAGNAAGTVLTNTGTLSITDGSGATLTFSDTEQAEIVEPSFELTKTADREVVQGGDIVTYTIRLAPVASTHGGPMFDITLTDDLLSGMLTLVSGSIALVSAPAGTITSDAGGVVTITVPVLMPGETIEFTYQALVEQTVPAGTELPNTVELTGDSYPGTPPTHPGVPPVDTEREYTDDASESVLVSMPKIEKTVSEADTPISETGSGAYDPDRPDLAIGEVVTYTITVTMPEAYSYNVRLSDILPGAGGAGGMFGLIGAEIIHVGANLKQLDGSDLIEPGADLTDSNGDGVLDTVLFDFGSILNVIDGEENDGDRITFTVTARVLDHAANYAGLMAVNTATIRVSNQAGTVDSTASATAAVDIVEPLIVLEKVTNVASGDAGDRVSYEVRVPIGGPDAGPAFELRVTDTLPEGVTIDVSTLRFVNGALAGATLSYDDATRTISAYVPLYTSADPDIIIGYDVILDDTIRHDDLLTNTAEATWQSAPTNTPEARGGEAEDSATVRVVLPAAIEKVVVDTSVTETLGTDVAIGELVTYEIRVTLGEGTQTVRVQDSLPAGLAFVSGEVISIGGNISGTTIGAGAQATIVGQDVTFDFGTNVVNRGDTNVVDGRDVIVMRVVARVLPGSDAATVLTNEAAFVTESGTHTDEAEVEVVKPVVVITKDASTSQGDAGDEIEFTVVIRLDAGSTAPLFDLEAVDALPAGYVLVAGSASATRGTVTESGNTVRVTLPYTGAGAALMPTDDPLTPVDDTRIVITYRAVLADSVEPGQVLTNEVDYTGVSAPGGATGTETFTGSDTAAVTVTMPVTIEKQVYTTSIGDDQQTDVAVGETVTYRLIATLSEGTQTLVITDTLPPGLQVLSARVVAIGAGLSQDLMDVVHDPITGQTVRFNFGTVVNVGNNIAGDGTVEVEIVALVRDVPSNVDGTTLINDGEATVTSPTDPQAPGGTQTGTDDVTVQVVEPELVLEKTAESGYFVAGEEITYTVTLSHASGSNAAAYDIVLTDLLTDPYLTLVTGTVSASAGTVALGNSAGDATVRVDLGALALGQVLTVTFTVRVSDDAPAATTFVNTATANFDSAPGEGGRPDEVTDDATAPGVPVLVKEIFSTSNADTDDGDTDGIPDLAIGEVVTYRLTITLPQGSTDNLVLSDLLPPSLQPISQRVVTVGSGLTVGTTDMTITGQSVAFSFGTVVNASGAGIGAEDQIVVEIEARVVNLDGLAAGDPIINAAEATFTIDGRDGTLDVSVPAELVEPQLVITKEVDKLSGDAGDVFTYTVTVGHAAGSTSAAYDLVIEDLLDDVFLVVSVSPSVGTATVVGNLIRVTLDSLQLSDDPLEITYVVALRDTIEPGQVVGNTATLGYDSDPDVDGRPNTAEASAPDITGVFSLNVTKEIVATSLSETGDDRFDPAIPDLAVGETVTYEIVATLSEGTQTLVITDLIPEGLLPLAGQAVVYSMGGSITAGSGGTLSPVAVIDGQRVTFDFGTLVNTGDNLNNDDDKVVVRITARVLDAPINTNGREVENDAEATIASPTDPLRPGGSVTEGDSALAEIVVLRYLIDKAVNATGGDAGDVFTFTLTISPEAGTDAPAFDLLIEDLLPPFLVVVPGSLTTSAGTAEIDGNLIRVEIPVMTPNAAPIIITYQAAFSDAIEPGQVVENRATLEYASAPDFGRDLGDEAEASVRGEFELSVTKEIVATSLTETGSGFYDPTLPDLAAGETVTYHLTVGLSEGTQRLVVVDTLPPGLVAEDVRVVSVGTGIAAASPTIVIVGNRITLDFGVVVNEGDNLGGDEIVIEVVARLNATQPAGTVLVNQAEATATAPTDPSAEGGTLVATDTASAESVAAILVFDKTASPLSAGMGETITYTVTLSHPANSSAPAYEIVLFDPMTEAALQLINGTVVVSMGTVVLGNNGGDTGIRVILPVLMPDEVLVVTFQARVVGIPIPDGAAVNTAGYESTSAPGDIPPGFTRPSSGEDSAVVQIVSGQVQQDGALFADYDDVFRRISRNTLNAPMILTGTAQPGAAVALGLQDANGGPINIIGVTADVGGHWVASPIEPGAPGSAEVQASDGMDRVAGRQGSHGMVPAAPTTAGLDLAAYTVQAAQAPAAFDVRAGMDGLRSTFAGVIQSHGAFVGAADSPGQAAAASIATQVQRDMVGLSAPNSLAWNRFALDFAASTTAASLAGR